MNSRLGIPRALNGSANSSTANGKGSTATADPTRLGTPRRGLKTGLERTLPHLRSLDEGRPELTELAVIVPATNEPPSLGRCLDAIYTSSYGPDELIVVDDPATGGAGGARNAGAVLAKSSVLVFVDSDVEVHPDALQRIKDAFDADPELTALFGSYDDEPDAPGAVSGFYNLHHHYVHHANAGPATTFWSGLGAIRTDAFRAAGGFDPAHPIEDIELGMRLSAQGARIRLDPAVRGKHLKAWTLRQMMLSDFIIRGAPWVELLLRHRVSSRTLNLGWRHRLSAAACVLGLGALPMRRPAVAAGATFGLLALNHSFYSLLLMRRGPVEAGAGIGLHVIHHLVAAASVPAGVVLHLANRTAPPAAARSPERTSALVA